MSGAGSSAKYRNPSVVSASPDGTWAAVLDGGNRGNNAIRRLDLTSGVSSTITGGQGSGFADGSAQQAKFSSPQGLAVSPDGKWIAVVDSGNDAIRRVDVTTSVTSTFLGLQTGSGLPAAGGFTDGFAPQKLREVAAAVCSTSKTRASADEVVSVAIDSSTTSLTLTVTHEGSFQGEIEDERQAFAQKASTFQADIAARLSIDVSSIRIECAVSDCAPACCSGTPPLHKVGNSTEVRFVVSNLAPARVNKATRLAFSADGTMLVLSDTGNNAVRKLDLVSMTLTTLAGKSTGEAGFRNGHASNAVLEAPGGVAISADKRIVLIAEAASHSVRRLDLQMGQISTLAGNGSAGALNGKAASSTFRSPADVSFGPGDSWALVVDKGNTCVWVRGCVGAWVRGCVGAWVRVRVRVHVCTRVSVCVGAWVFVHVID